MVRLELSDREAAQVATACAHVRLRECTPALLQDFLVLRLTGAGAHALAVKVEGYDPEQMHALCELIRRRQRLACAAAAGA